MTDDNRTPAEYGAEGGRRRAENLEPDRRTEIARLGAAARWAVSDEQLPQVLCGSPDRPLRIVDIEIPCYVLEDERRVLSQRGVVGALGMKYGTRVGGADRLTGFLSGKSISDNVSNELMALIANPIRFRGSGGTTFGYPATILADICEVVLSARKAGTLQKQQEHIADRAEILVRGFARVGIIALVDEATGFQEIRAKDELHRLLALYLSEERLKWAKRFPDEFYRQLYRLRDWKWPNGVKRTPLVGRITNEIVYEKLPPGVLQELWARNPTMEGTGRRRWKHHQFLSEDIGQPDLRDHLLQLIAVMRVSRSWGEFEENFERAFPGPQGNFDFLPQSE